MVTTVAILFLCLYPFGTNSSVPLFPHFDKFIHFGMHMFLVGSILFEMQRVKFYNITSKRLGIYAFLYSFLLGVSIEIIQDLMNVGREFDPFDVLANSTGAITGVLLGNKWFRRA